MPRTHDALTKYDRSGSVRHAVRVAHLFPPTMLKAFRTLRERKCPTSTKLPDFDTASVGQSLRTEDQFTLEISCVRPDQSSTKVANVGLQTRSSQDLIPQASDISSMTTHSDTTSEGSKSGRSSDSSESSSIVYTQTSQTSQTTQTTRTRRLQAPPSFLESLGIIAGGMCGMVPLDENASVAEQANCVNTLFFVNDEKTSGFFGGTTVEPTTSHNGASAVTLTVPTQDYNQNDDEEDYDIAEHVTRGIGTNEESALAPISFGKSPSLRKRTFLLKLFRERRARRQETTLLTAGG